MRVDEAEWPVRPPGRTRPQFTRAQDRRLAALRGRRDRTAKELAIDADLIAPRAALERVAVEGDAALAALLPWQQSLLGG